MEFSVEFYTTAAGSCPVREFLLAEEACAMSKTNFDLFLEEQLHDPDFAERFKRAGEAWDVALQLAALREQAGFSQKELARRRPSNRSADWSRPRTRVTLSACCAGWRACCMRG